LRRPSYWRFGTYRITKLSRRILTFQRMYLENHSPYWVSGGWLSMFLKNQAEHDITMIHEMTGILRKLNSVLRHRFPWPSIPLKSRTMRTASMTFWKFETVWTKIRASWELSAATAHPTPLRPLPIISGLDLFQMAVYRKPGFRRRISKVINHEIISNIGAQFGDIYEYFVFAELDECAKGLDDCEHTCRNTIGTINGSKSRFLPQ